MALMNDDKERAKRIKEMIDALTSTPIINYSKYINEYLPRYGEIPAEVEEEGNVYGYKVLIWDIYAMRFHSLVYPVYWSTQLGELTADMPPCEENRNGIYFMKQLNDPEINDYFRSAKYQAHKEREFVFIVRCVLVGRIVEAERGFRSEHARIEGVYNNGYWETYQNFRAEAETYYRRRYEEPMYTYQDWESITRYDARGNADQMPRLASTDEDSAAD